MNGQWERILRTTACLVVMSVGCGEVLVAQPFLEVGRRIRLAEVSQVRPSGSPTYVSTWVRGEIVTIDGSTLELRRGGSTHRYLLGPTSRLLPIPASSSDTVGRPVRLSLADGARVMVGGASIRGTFTGVFGGSQDDELWVVTSLGSQPAAVPMDQILSAQIAMRDGTGDGLLEGATVGAGVGLAIAALASGAPSSGEIAKLWVGMAGAGAMIGGPIGLLLGAIRGPDWEPLNVGRR